MQNAKLVKISTVLTYWNLVQWKYIETPKFFLVLRIKGFFLVETIFAPISRSKTSLELRKLAYHTSTYFDRFQLKLDIFRMYTANRPVLPGVKDEARPPSVLPTPYVVFCQETQSNQMGCGTVFNYCPAAPRFDTSSVERHQGLANLGMNTSSFIFNI